MCYTSKSAPHPAIGQFADYWHLFSANLEKRPSGRFFVSWGLILDRMYQTSLNTPWPAVPQYTDLRCCPRYFGHSLFIVATSGSLFCFMAVGVRSDVPNVAQHALASRPPVHRFGPLSEMFGHSLFIESDPRVAFLLSAG